MVMAVKGRGARARGDWAVKQMEVRVEERSEQHQHSTLSCRRTCGDALVRGARALHHSRARSLCLHAPAPLFLAPSPPPPSLSTHTHTLHLLALTTTTGKSIRQLRTRHGRLFAECNGSRTLSQPSSTNQQSASTTMLRPLALRFPSACSSPTAYTYTPAYSIHVYPKPQPAPRHQQRPNTQPATGEG
jgi:hypothetical protein